ncbi:hypothetical protein LBMAG56_41880 [Verrucomicrobiota bacterium]|nr:hypothetical protein LBMAG56_41880 [Verrucomicrobiota bacterium]
MLDKCIAGLTVLASMAGIIKLYSHARAHRLAVAEQEINVFARDAVFCALVLARAGNKEDVAQIDFGADGNCVARR